MQVLFKVGRKLVFLNTPGSADTITLNEDSNLAAVAGTSGGISHFGFQLVQTSLDAAVREVEKAGGKLLERGEHAPGVPYAYVADPDGYTIEL